MSKQPSFHEDYGSGDAPRPGSDRSFGLVFTVVFAIIALAPVVGGDGIVLWAAVVAAILLAISLLCPSMLRPANRLWFGFGSLLHRVVSPLVMGFLFFFTVTPTGLVMRICGKDPLRLKFDRAAPTYWIKRDPLDPAPDTMRRQF